MAKLALCIWSILFCSQLSAASLRCGSALVKKGDSVNVLTSKCGLPLRKYAGREVVNQSGKMKNVGVSNWVYSRTGKKDKIVSVRNGKVIQIQVD